jgi:hypothetical protein
MTCGQGHPLSPQGWQLTREGWLEDGYGLSDPSDQIDVGISPPVPVVESVAKRYAEGRVGVVAKLYFAERGLKEQLKELRSIFYRSVEEGRKVCLSPSEVSIPQRPCESLSRDDNGWQGAVFVDVVDVIQNGQEVSLGPVPSVIRLQLADLIHPLGGDTLETITGHRRPMLLDSYAGEGITVGRDLPVGEHQLPNEIVQRGPKIGEHVPEDETQVSEHDRLIRRLLSHLPAPMNRMGWIRVHIHSDAVDLSIDELVPMHLERVGVELGTFQLGPNDAHVTGHG